MISFNKKLKEISKENNNLKDKILHSENHILVFIKEINEALDNYEIFSDFVDKNYEINIL